MFSVLTTLQSILPRAIERGGGGTPIWNRRGRSSEILNLTPKETIWVWHKEILTPKRDCLKKKKKCKKENLTSASLRIILCFFAEPYKRRPWRLKILVLCPEHPIKQEENPKFTPLSETTSNPVCFIYESHQPTPPPHGAINNFT